MFLDMSETEPQCMLALGARAPATATGSSRIRPPENATWEPGMKVASSPFVILPNALS